MSRLCSALPGLRLAGEPLSSCCPSRLSLLPQDGDLKPWCFIGARQRAGRSRTSSQGFQPASDPEGFGDAGASSGVGAGPLPISPCALLRVPAPSPPCLWLRAQGSLHWASLGGRGSACPGTQPAPWDTLTTAWHLLSWHPCPAASGPTSHTAAMLWSRAGQIFAPVLAQAGFAAGIAAAPVLRRELEATSALPQQQQQPGTAPGDTEEVDLGTKPSDPDMAALRKLNHARKLQQKKEEEYVQVMPVLMSPLPAGLSQLSFILDGQSTRGSDTPEQHSVLFCGDTKASGISELIFIERGVKQHQEMSLMVTTYPITGLPPVS